MLTAPSLAGVLRTSTLFLLTAAASAAPAPAQQGATLPDSWVQHLDWRNIGPANMGGRITSVAVHPTDPATYWIGSAGGGILHTSNRGVTYYYQFTSESTSSIGALCVAPSNPEVIWAGTGESNPRNSVSWGHGVFKSTDSGKTWKNMGLEESFQIGVVRVHPTDENIVYVGTLGRLWGESEQRGLYKTTDGGENWERVLFIDDKTGIIDMRLDPRDPATMVVATYERKRDGFDTNDPAKKWGEGSGLWKSTDGGKTWKELRDGLPSGKLGRIGLDYSLSEPGVVYAVVEAERITQEPENAAWMGLTGENAEVGARVTRIEDDSPASEAKLQVGDIVLQMDGKTVHSWSDMQAAIRRHVAGETVGLIASRDRKTVEVDVTFRTKPSEEEDGGNQRGPRGGVDEAADAEGGDEEASDEDAPPPPGPFHLGLGGQVANVQDQQGPDGHEYGGIYRSDNGGDSWTRVNSLNPRPMYYSRIYVDPSDGNYIYVLGTQLHKSSDRGETFTPDGHNREVHVDHHNMWINPADGRNMVLGNDGGIYVTHDRMENWDHHNHVAIGQFYQIEADATRDYRVYGGLQDNGSWGGPNKVNNNRGPVNSDWFNIGGGDGFVVRVDKDNPNQIYGESQNGYTYRLNLETGEQGSIRARAPRGESYRFNWNTPFILSEHNSEIYYSAGNHVFRSPNQGIGIEAISPEISLTDRGAATALHESPVREGVIYVGTDDGAMWMTPDGGKQWIDLFNPPAKEEEAAQGEATAEGEAGERPAGRRGQGRGQGRGQAPAAEGGDIVPEATASEPGAAQEPAASPLNGAWSGKIEAEEIPAGEGAFTMNLRFSEDGKVSGSMTTDMGDSTLSKGSYDAEKKSLRVEFNSDQISGIITGTIEGNVLTGEIDAGPGMITFDYSATHEAPAAPAARGPQGGRRGGGAGEAAAGRGQGGGEAAGGGRGGGQAGGGRGGFQDRDISDLPPEVQERIRQRQAEFGGQGGGAGFGGPGAGRGGAAAAAGEGDGSQALIELMPGRFHVSSIQASQHRAERVYASFDGHRSNDGLPHVMVSENMGLTWKSLRGNLPDSAGSARVITEDYANQNLLFLGTEFGAWASIDRGASWTRINNGDLPTVPVHDFKLHRLTGELIAGTHGRSIWIVDVSTLRQLSVEAMAERAKLYTPEEAVLPTRGREQGSSGTRRFVGENPAFGLPIRYSLGSRARAVELTITDIRGDVIWEAEAETGQGLHEARWDMRAASQGGGGRRFGRSVPAGQYLVTLKVDGASQTQIVEVLEAE
jgi:photosystem II stability/assembly factor-like uncharacterized protein